MSTRIPCWKLQSSLLDSSLLRSLSLLGVESLSWSGVFFDLTVDGDGCLLFLIIWPWRFLLRMVGIWSSRWGGRQGINLSYRQVLGKLGCLWWRRRVQKWKKQSCECQEIIFWKKTCTSSRVFCPSDRRVFSWTRSLLSYCIPFGCDGGLPLLVCKRLADRALYWSSTAMVAKIWMINSVSDNTMWFCKKYGFTATGQK